jgi:hypothetical protein
MSTPLFFPVPRVVAGVDATGAVPLRVWLERAGAPCRATGRWTERPVQVATGALGITKAPGDWTAVCVSVPPGLSAVAVARLVVAAMAYAVMDPVARESVRGQPWARPAPPRGRPRLAQPRTGAQRQRAYRARRQG